MAKIRAVFIFLRNVEAKEFYVFDDIKSSKPILSLWSTNEAFFAQRNISEIIDVSIVVYHLC